MNISKNPSDPARRWLAGWIPFAAYNGAVIYFSVIPYDGIPPILQDVSDLLLHAGGYFFLFLASANAFRRAILSRLAGRPLRNAFLWCFLIASLTEWAQLYVPGRYAAWIDWIANLSGALAAWGIWRAAGSRFARSFARERRTS